MANIYIERLRELSELHQSGALTDEEYASKKAEILTLAPIGLADDKRHQYAEAEEPAVPAPEKAPAQDEKLTPTTVLGMIVLLAIVVAVIWGIVAIVSSAIQRNDDAEYSESEALPASGAATVAPEWYEGGSLHSASPQQWRNAIRRNRLATAADWAATLAWMEVGNEGTLTAADYVAMMHSTHNDEVAAEYIFTLRTVAVELMTCVDESYAENIGDPANTVAVICSQFMK